MLTSLDEYLKPNPFLRPPRPTPELWTPPESSRGLRAVPMRSRGSSHGHIVLVECLLDFESRLERNVALAVLARPDTDWVVEQSPRVEWVDDDGEVHEHTFDLHVMRTDGTRSAVFVKPSELFKPSMRRMLKLIATQMSPSVAQQVVPITEKNLTRADLHNAELIQEVRREPYREDDAVIADLVADLNGPVRIAELVENSGLNGFGFRAVVRAIADGKLRLMKRGMIAHSVLVERRQG